MTASPTIAKARARREDALLNVYRSSAPPAPQLLHDPLPPFPIMRTDYARQCYCRWLAKEAERLVKEDRER